MSKVLVQIMSSNSITMSSTKADIIQSAEELIGDLDEKLTKEARLTRSLREERTSLVYLLVGVSVYTLNF